MSRKRVLRLIAAASVSAIGVGAATVPAQAASPRTQHVTRTLGPFDTVVPAGAYCNFTYEERATVQLNIVQFFDSSGNLTSLQAQADLTVDHVNDDTGAVLSEEDHYARRVDFASGDYRDAGQTWQLRSEDGHLVLSGAGLFEADLITDHVLSETPHVIAHPEMCALLGGAEA